VKKVGVVGGVLAVVLIALVVLWVVSVDRVVRLAIEHYGSDALGTEVTVDSVDIRARAGRGTIRGLRAAQPDGFGAGDVIAIDELTLGLDASSLVSGDPYVVSVVHVAGPVVAFVMRTDGSNNVQVLQENVSRFGASEQAEPVPPDDAGPGVRLRIDEIAIERGRILADLSAMGAGRTEAALPSFRMADVGAAQGAAPGAIAASVGSRFLAHVLTAITRSTVGRQLDRLLDAGGSDVRNLLDSLFDR
jgi:hypothetical protein